MKVIKTADKKSIRPYLMQLKVPRVDSHKGQNGKLMIIGGSELFHSASLWSAEIASHFVDMVHYSSVKENNEVFLYLKKIFRNGIIVSQVSIPNYIDEDDAVLIGPGMVRKEKTKINNTVIDEWSDVISLEDEGDFSHYSVKYLIDHFPKKRYIFDAGALQMMDVNWLTKLHEKPILTPHQLEFEQLFNVSIKQKNLDDKISLVKSHAKKYKCVIILKAVVDIVSDGEEVLVIEGGNAGLTKGGSGDILAGLTSSLYTKNNPLVCAVLSSYLTKRSADRLFSRLGYWYNMLDLIAEIPVALQEVI